MSEDRMQETAETAVEDDDVDGMFPFDISTLDGARKGVRPGIMMLGVLSGLFALIGVLALLSVPWDGMFGEDVTAESFTPGLIMVGVSGVALFLASVGGVLCRLIAERSQIAIYVAMGFVGLFLIGSIFLIMSPVFIVGIILLILTSFIEFTLVKAMTANSAYKKLTAQASQAGA